MIRFPIRLTTNVVTAIDRRDGIILAHRSRMASTTHHPADVLQNETVFGDAAALEKLLDDVIDGGYPSRLVKIRS